ncbi:hypothetical protein P170DRAFT_463963 [Aspergillus steynii IBT 23096]|uniref:ABM domain-containing protein n=1 Tax=Aspergillus steynii IBT 23096 TaxID=1392250 RepID=A0A2I2GDG5_9EURO|nr:uncharacterized protein P170DRAFT_463963 [Aspergillus steynii IBT 23096]PLB50912.1 hypothetical protein P170DRAFT_463963 [Aspergillus steynii IBT 23096]
MATTELIFPSIKTDPESLNEIERDWPVISKRLTHPNPGLLNAFRGFLLTEDGVDVRGAHREFLLFEWTQADDFHRFVKSEQFAEFAASIKHLVTGPPTLQLFETNVSPREAASAAVVEIIRLSVSDAANVETAVHTWEVISRLISDKRNTVNYGTSTNLENIVVVGIIGWESSEAQAQTTQDWKYVEAIDALRSLGAVNRLTVGIDPMELSSM